ncbi:serine/threonine protein kinase [Oceanicoccus sagamiensis]|uniref:Stress response kinase A n=1 Tax=Oceanicoccus sagamiensis TaxID=716816 RepID=A0A1X9NAN7_9GAMM|nr:serine/threonine protein kinase [Oceanicoccus sagamiensis]ARN74221.1 stress response serine/threonine protein kinase YihE [Oceanicoccus sagamiensis]
MPNPHPYDRLTPELVIDAVESTGRLTDLRIFPLNSYENRVYQVGMDEGDPVIVKFYRPERWTEAQILEEHEFSYELFDAEIPVVPPLKNEDGKTLLDYDGYQFSVYQRKGGHAPELDDLDNLLILGRLTGRIHAIGAMKDFQHRPTLDIQSFGENSFQLISEHFIPNDLRTAYVSLCEDLLKTIKEQFAQTTFTNIRVHGDCHSGNILWRGESPHFVDLDDSRMAPAIQDLWMFMSGDRPNQTAQISELVEGYNEFFDFDPRQLHLIEALRTLRIIHYSAWLARRWEDPAFPHNFPWFNTARYWSDHILELREQFALINEPALQLF